MMAPVALRLSRSTAFGDLFRHRRCPVAAPNKPEHRRLPQPGQRLPQLGLEHHQRREDAVGEDHAEQVGDHGQLEQEGGEVDDRQHQQPEDDLQRAGADQEPQERVETYATMRISSRSRQPGVGNGSCSSGTTDLPRPGPGRARRARPRRREPGRAARPRSQARAQAVAVARSRCSTGWPVTAPRNRLRDGPTSTGRPSAWSAVELVEQQDVLLRRSSRSRGRGRSRSRSGATPAAAAAAQARRAARPALRPRRPP